MLKVKNTLVLAGMFTAWPVLCFGMADPNSRFQIPASNGDINLDFVSALMKSIFFIIVLGGIAFYISKKFMPKLRPSVGRDINIRETIHLGPNKTVHLIEVGEKTFFVGSTSDNISMLADVTETLEDSCENEII
jgi:flagellar biogenesis protein FliO